MRKYCLLLMLAVSVCLAAACGGKEPAAPPEKDRPPVIAPQQTSITVVAVGDFLMHMPVVYSVKDEQTGQFAFGTIFEPVREYIEGADYSIANLETRLAGAETGYTGYPRFNCPADLAFEMRALGLDMFLTANNHCLDRGVEGIINTNRNLAETGLDHIGTYSSAGEKVPFIKEIKGIRLGIINYTESTNGLPVPGDKPYLVNIYDPVKAGQEIQQLKEAGADVILACIHFGDEYTRLPNEKQRDTVDHLFNAGADAVLGHHVHVVQPVMFKTIEENGEIKKKFASFSLGNFISNQRDRYSDSGLLAKLTFTKDFTGGGTSLGEVELVPVYVDLYYDNGRKHYRVVPVRPAIEAYENSADPLLTESDYRRLVQVDGELGRDFLIMTE